MDGLSKFKEIRQYTTDLCKYLKTEDYVVQPIYDVSPPKWHLGHTTWAFENFVLKVFAPNYQVYNPVFEYIFNSYYESVGKHADRSKRGTLSRPTVEEIMAYRHYVDDAMEKFLSQNPGEDVFDFLELGINHEQQHQELLLADIKWIFGHNPLYPVYRPDVTKDPGIDRSRTMDLIVDEGVYEIGYQGKGFHYDNEDMRHKVYLNKFAIESEMITNGDFLEFMEDGGYDQVTLWLSDGWLWIKANQVGHPEYWVQKDGQWFEFTLSGLKPLDLKQPVCHLSYYEAAAFAEWSGKRLPTEAEWEAASHLFEWGRFWEWTNSAYLPYPGFEKLQGSAGEYNGKFMSDQMVLRGASFATPQGHSRESYRNYYQPYMRLPFTGLRLVKSL